MNQTSRLSLVDWSDPDLSVVAQCRLLKVRGRRSIIRRLR